MWFEKTIVMENMIPLSCWVPTQLSFDLTRGIGRIYLRGFYNHAAYEAVGISPRVMGDEIEIVQEGVDLSSLEGSPMDLVAASVLADSRFSGAVLHQE